MPERVDPPHWKPSRFVFLTVLRSGLAAFLSEQELQFLFRSGVQKMVSVPDWMWFHFAFLKLQCMAI